MNNLLNIIKMIKNPQEFVMNTLCVNNNQILNNLVKMAQNGDKQGVENFARNYFKEQGKDFDEIMNSFK